MQCINDTASSWTVLWSAYLHAESRTSQNLRGMVLGIYGGLGAHRYPIVGSGDTFAAWETIAFEVGMTISAGNVATGWTHDLGGFMGPIKRNPELYLRWLQYGIFTPLFRTHCDHCESRIWYYPNYPLMKQTFLFRNSLVPYIYTASRQSYETGQIIVKALYFKWPTFSQAYLYNATEYIFGDSLLVAPIAEPVNPATNTTQKTVWIPPGEWINWQTGQKYNGPLVVSPSFGFADIPVYALAGSIIPMRYPSNHGLIADPLILTIFPGSDGEAVFYEDDGETLDYQNEAYTKLRVVQTTVASSMNIKIFPQVEGNGYPGQLLTRKYEIHLRDVSHPLDITCNGEPIKESNTHEAPGWWVTTEDKVSVAVIAIGSFSTNTDVVVSVTSL